MKTLYGWLMVAALMSCSRPAGVSRPEPAAGRQCRVLFWEDGDTLLADCGGSRETVRLVGIDTAESGFDDNSRARGRRQARWWKIPLERVFACGKQASKWVRRRCPVGTPVTISGSERDKYQRLLGRVFCRGQDINAALLAAGLAGAYPYPRLPACPARCCSH